MNRRLLILASAPLLAAVAFAADDHPTGPRITPPTIRSAAPLGVSRGTTAELTVEGFNLAGASRIFFSEPGVTGRIVRVKELPDLPDIRLGSNGTPSTIDVGPLPPRNQVTVEVDVAPEAEIGPVSFRLQTPLGSSPASTFLIEPYYGESPDNEPNDSLESAFETYLPTIMTGAISRPGDVDYFKLKVQAGQEVTFENSAAMVGSQLQPIVAIVDGSLNVLKEFGLEGGRAMESFSYRFAAAGTYYVRITDYQRKGSGGHFYRIKAGDFPLVSSVYPLGVPAGKAADIRLMGANLGGGKQRVEGKASPEDPNAVVLRADAPAGRSFNKVMLDLGQDTEVEAAPGQVLNMPVTVNGRLTRPVQDFRFRANKGQKLVFEVKARRLGSDLDSYLEVLDAQGKSIEQLVVRPVWETPIVLRDHDSAARGIRIQSWNALREGDYVLMGGEVARVDALPKQPDEDCLMESFGGQRIGYFGTTPEAHAADSMLYKAQIFPPGTQLSPNGLPVTRLYYRNDDGGPGYQKDSLLTFTAPAAGEYILRLRDVRGMSGEQLTYRLNARETRPDFRLSINPRNPNVHQGGTIPLTVTAFRMEGFTDPIEVQLEGLPAGLTATKAVIGAGQVNGTLLLTAAAGAKLETAAPLKAIGQAMIAGRSVAREASPDDRLKLITIGPKPDVVMTSETREVEIEAGGTAEITVSIVRQNGFGGRVPVEVRNLPPRVQVDNSGLNGVLLNEGETRRTFKLAALPMAQATEQIIYVSGVVETRSPQQNTHAAPQAIRLKVVRPRTEVSSTAVPAVTGAPRQ